MTRVLLIICLAASAGVHVALASAHGPSFLVAAALLAVAACTIVVLPPLRLPALAAGALQAELLMTYLAFRGDEAVDGVAVATRRSKRSAWSSRSASHR